MWWVLWIQTLLQNKGAAAAFEVIDQILGSFTERFSLLWQKSPTSVTVKRQSVADETLSLLTGNADVGVLVPSVQLGRSESLNVSVIGQRHTVCLTLSLLCYQHDCCPRLICCDEHTLLTPQGNAHTHTPISVDRTDRWRPPSDDELFITVILADSLTFRWGFPQ